MWLVTPKGDMLNLDVAHEVRCYDWEDESEVVVVMPTINVTVMRGTAEECNVAAEHIATGIASGWPVIYMGTKGETE